MKTTISALSRITLAIIISVILAVTAASAQTRIKRRPLTPTPAAATTTTDEKPAETTPPATTATTDTAATDTAATDTAATDTASTTTDAAAEEEAEEEVPPTEEELFAAMSGDEKLAKIKEINDAILGHTGGGIVRGYDLQRHTNAVVSNMQESTGVTRQGMVELEQEDARIRKNLRTMATYLKYALGFIVLLLITNTLLLFGVSRKTTSIVIGFLAGAVLAYLAWQEGWMWGLAVTVPLVIAAFFLTKNKPINTVRVVSAFIIGLLSLGLVSQQAYAATAPCTITRISSGSLVVKEQDPSTFRIAVRNCDVKSIESIPGVTFDGVVQKGNTVTAKVKADASALTGPVAFQVTLADGSNVESPEGVDIFVYDMATATVNEKAESANSKATKVAKDLKAATAKLSAELTARPTKAEVGAIVATATAPLDARLCDIETVVASLLTESVANAQRVAVFGQATQELAEVVQVGFATKVKKSFWGGAKPLNPEASEAAARILAAVAKANNN